MKAARFSSWLLILASLAVGLVGCGGSGGSSTPGDVPTLRIHLTDAPFPSDRVVSAVVEVESIEIRGETGGFQPLTPFTPKLFDLVDLRNGVTEVLFEGVLEPGDYDALRLVCNPVEIAIREGETTRTFTQFTVPSGPQRGVQVMVDPVLTLVTEFTEDLLLDMDLSRSFVVQGNPDTPAGIKGFHFQPVVRAVNQSVAGTLTLRVMSDNGTPGEPTDDFYLNGASYEVLDGDTLVASGVSGPRPLTDGGGFSEDPMDQGYIRNPGIPAGEYNLVLTRDGYAEHSSSLTIWVSNLTDLGSITLTAEAGYITGTVSTELSDTSGNPVAVELGGATVSSEPVDAGAVVSESDGTYILEYTPPFTTQTVTAVLEGYVEGSVDATPVVSGADPGSANIVLVPLTTDLELTLMDDANPANPLAGVTVELRLPVDRTPLMGVGITDVDGKVPFVGLPTAEYLITVLLPGAEATPPTVAVVGGGAPVVTTVVVNLPSP